MIMQLLKSATRPNHDRVEALAYSDKIMDGTITLAQYGELILKQHYFHKQLEPYFEKVFSEKELVRLEILKRQKTDLLKNDLLELGLNEENLSFDKLPYINIESSLQALGAMYVLEGSTLGGAVIRRRLEKNPEITEGSSFHFYGCYGEQTGEFWKKFVMQATIMADTEEKQKIVVDKAVETFNYFENILKLGKLKLKTAHEQI